MKTTLKNLHGFLENAKKNGTTCAEAKKKLALAENMKTEIDAIIKEIKQINDFCLLYEVTQQNKEDDSECGV